MFIIGENTLVSLDVLEKEFCCDLDTCRGCCCIEGDAGCPVESEEEDAIRKILPSLLPEMTKEAREVVEKQGIAYNDPSGERVLSIVRYEDNWYRVTFTNDEATESRQIEAFPQNGKVIINDYR